MVKPILENDYYKNLDLESKIGLSRILDLVEIVLNRKISRTTDFLDPSMIYLAESILNQFDNIEYEIFGGYEGAERCIIRISPFYMQKSFEDICLFEIESREELNHRNILGSVLGLGIDRNKIGDIIVDKKSSYLFAKRELANFLSLNFSKVGRASVAVKELALKDFVAPEIKYVEKRLIISSLRLDAFISGVLRLSRAKSQELIRAGKVKLNHRDIFDVSHILEEDSLISVRGYGRVIFYRIENKSKKDKFIIIIRTPE